MISFRFHVVSITAVFLALAIGVVVGSTYVDRAIVDNLQNRIDTVSANLDRRKADNDELERQLHDSQQFVAASLDFAATDRLTEVPVLIVATRGIDDDAAKAIVQLARRAGAVVPGIVWVEPKSGLSNADDTAQLADIVEARATTAPEDLWSAAWAAVAHELVLGAADNLPVSGLDPSTTTTLDPAAVPTVEVLDALVDAGFLSVDNVDDDTAVLPDLAGSGARTLVLTGSNASNETAPLAPVVVEAMLGAKLASVVADVYVEHPGGPARGEAINDALSDDVRAAIGLVDDADLPEGQLAAVLALDSVADGVVGHFGYGSGADSVLPAWSSP